MYAQQLNFKCIMQKGTILIIETRSNTRIKQWVQSSSSGPIGFQLDSNYWTGLERRTAYSSLWAASQLIRPGTFYRDLGAIAAVPTGSDSGIAWELSCHCVTKRNRQAMPSMPRHHQATHHTENFWMMPVNHDQHVQNGFGTG